jgi:hypothetical protein
MNTRHSKLKERWLGVGVIEAKSVAIQNYTPPTQDSEMASSFRKKVFQYLHFACSI